MCADIVRSRSAVTQCSCSFLFLLINGSSGISSAIKAGLAVESKTSAAERRLLNNASAVPSTSAAATGSGMKGSRHASSDESKAPGNVIFSNSR